jgi:hypothetical protein
MCQCACVCMCILFNSLLTTLLSSTQLYSTESRILARAAETFYSVACWFHRVCYQVSIINNLPILFFVRCHCKCSYFLRLTFTSFNDLVCFVRFCDSSSPAFSQSAFLSMLIAFDTKNHIIIATYRSASSPLSEYFAADCALHCAVQRPSKTRASSAV